MLLQTGVKFYVNYFADIAICRIRYKHQFEPVANLHVSQ